MLIFFFFYKLQYISLNGKSQSLDISQTNRCHRDWEIVRMKRKVKGITRLNCVLCCFMSSCVSTMDAYIFMINSSELKASFDLWVSVSSIGKVSDCCIRDLGFNFYQHQKLIDVLV